MATVRDIIAGSLRLISVVAAGETPTAQEQADALVSLNDMIETWSNEGLMIFKTDREVFPLTSGKSSYTIGPLGDFATSRPMQVMDVKSTLPDTVVTIITPYDPGDPLAIPPIPETPEVTQTSYLAKAETPVDIFNIQQWGEIRDKRTTGSLVSKVFFQGTYPLETMDVWPVPSIESGVVLYTLKALSSFTSVNDTVSLPPGYARALRYNLAVELAPEYEREAKPSVLNTANESKAALMRKNARPVLLKSDAEGMATNRSTFNIITGV